MKPIEGSGKCLLSKLESKHPILPLLRPKPSSLKVYNLPCQFRQTPVTS